MKFYEYGEKNNPTVVYIHGLGCDVLKSFKIPAEVLQEDYRFDKKALHDNPSRQTIYNSEYSCMTYTLPDNIRALHHCEVTYLYGEKEKQMMKGMLTLKLYLPNLKEIPWGNVGHGEIMAEKPRVYAEILKELLMNSEKILTS